MDIEAEANIARKSISNFCIEECRAYCCRKGFLAITLKEKNLMIIGESDVVIAMPDNMFSLDLKGGCTMLKDFKCTIHTNVDRPKTCGDFPIFITGNDVMMSSRCLAVRENKFYGFISEFQRAGFRLIESQINSLDILE